METAKFYKSTYDSAKILCGENRSKFHECLGVVLEYVFEGKIYDGNDPIIMSTFLNAKPLADAYEKHATAGGQKGKSGDEKVSKKTSKKTSKKVSKKVSKKDTCGRYPSIEVEVEGEVEGEVEEEVEEEISSDEEINNSSIASNATSKVPSDAGQDSARLAHKKSGIVRDVVEYYNAKVRETGAKLRFCNTMADQRRSWILARVNEHGMEKVMQMIDKACASRFLNYEATNAPVNIDWLFRPNNFPKVLDGNFDNKDRASPPSPPPKEQMKSPIPEYSDEEWNALPFWEQDDAIHKHYGLD